MSTEVRQVSYVNDVGGALAFQKCRNIPSPPPSCTLVFLPFLTKFRHRYIFLYHKGKKKRHELIEQWLYH
jgi:hypothetical protein